MTYLMSLPGSIACLCQRDNRMQPSEIWVKRWVMVTSDVEDAAGITLLTKPKEMGWLLQKKRRPLDGNRGF